MKKNNSKKFFVTLAMFLLTATINVTGAKINLGVGIFDPTTDMGGPQRGPALVPEVSIEDYTLTFSTPCYGYTLELLDENGDVVYTTIITSTTVNLPTTLSGEYQLRLIPNDGGSIYFYGFVLF